MIANSSSDISNIGDIHVTYQVFEKSCLAKVLVNPGLMDVSSCLKAIRGKQQEVCPLVLKMWPSTLNSFNYNDGLPAYLIRQNNAGFLSDIIFVTFVKKMKMKFLSKNLFILDLSFVRLDNLPDIIFVTFKNFTRYSIRLLIVAWYLHWWSSYIERLLCVQSN